MDIKRIGLDLAKHVFEVHAVDGDEQVVLRKTLRREAVAQFFAELEPCLVGMEACCGSHYWKTLAAPCVSSLFTGTKRMLGCCAASQIASASAASFFCRFTYHQVAIMRRNVEQARKTPSFLLLVDGYAAHYFRMNLCGC